MFKKCTTTQKFISLNLIKKNNIYKPTSIMINSKLPSMQNRDKFCMKLDKAIPGPIYDPKEWHFNTSKENRVLYNIQRAEVTPPAEAGGWDSWGQEGTGWGFLSRQFHFLPGIIPGTETQSF